MTEQSIPIPDEFSKVIKDFVNDLRTTFPEYVPFINKWWKGPEHFEYIDEVDERNAAYKQSENMSIALLFDFCQKKFPPRFFDVLYQNVDMFAEGSDIDTEFLPNVHFKNLWQCEISDKTRETIWKYLQLIMFSIVGTLNNKEAFGDTAKMFEAINEDEFKTKLEETLSHMQGLFDLSGNESGAEMNPENIPDANKIHDHLTGMLGGKLGQLAKEIAEETASNLDIDFDGATDMKDIFKKLTTNPGKLMGLVKTVGDKLDSRIKSGELKESELISEATDLMNKMKNMPGMDNIQSMLSKMGMGNLSGAGGKVNVGATEASLKQKMKMAQTKERIRAKAEASAKARLEQQVASISQPTQPLVSEEELYKLFSSSEKIERTPRGGGGGNQQAQKCKKNKGKK